MERSQHNRQQRRRRMLADGLLGSDEGEAAVENHDGPRLRYGSSARKEHQPRLGDLIPRAWYTHLLLAALGLVLSAGIVALPYAPFFKGLARSPQAPGSLASWFSAISLFACVPVCSAILWFRRHRIDDYRARYRVWLACIVFFLAASAQAACNWLGTLREATSRIEGLPTGWERVLDEQTWTIGGAVLFVLAIARILWEVRTSVASIAYLSFATSVRVLGAVALTREDIIPLDAAWRGPATMMLVMAGDWLIFASLLRHAAYLVGAVECEMVVPKQAKPVERKTRKQKAVAETISEVAQAEPVTNKRRRASQELLDQELVGEETKKISRGWLSWFRREPKSADETPPTATTSKQTASRKPAAVKEETGEPVTRRQDAPQTLSGPHAMAKSDSSRETVKATASRLTQETVKGAPIVSSQDDDDEGDDSSDENRGSRILSKAERKAMRKAKKEQDRSDRSSRRFGRDEEW